MEFSTWIEQSQKTQSAYDYRISNDDYMPLLQRLFGMIDRQIENGDYVLEEFGALVEDLGSFKVNLESGLKRLEELRSQKKVT